MVKQSQILRLLDDKFEFIEAGYQKALIKTGHRDISEGELLLVGIKTDKVVKINVNKTEYKLVKDINNYDAQLAGFEDFEDFKKQLFEEFPNFSLEAEVTIIHFDSLVKMEEDTNGNSDRSEGCKSCGCN